MKSVPGANVVPGETCMRPAGPSSVAALMHVQDPSELRRKISARSCMASSCNVRSRGFILGLRGTNYTNTQGQTDQNLDVRFWPRADLFRRDLGAEDRCSFARVPGKDDDRRHYWDGEEDCCHAAQLLARKQTEDHEHG